MQLQKNNGNILYVLNTLKEYSDEANPISMKFIQEKIKELYGMDLDRRTISSNINVLINIFDYDISTYSDNGIGYYYIKNPEIEFETGEIRTIIDTFSYAPFIEKNISKEIIDKCKNMINIHERKKLNNYQIFSDNNKTINKEVIKNIEDISNAIFNKKKISFDYYKYELSPTLKWKKISEHVVSPYKLVYSIQELYLVALKKGEVNLYTYRIDRMKNINILDEASSKKITNKEIENHINSSISMYGSESEEIEAICNMSLLDNVIDVYGKNIKMRKYDDNNFKIIINKDIKAFKAYALRNIENMRVIKPIKLKQEIENILKDYLNQ